MSLVYSAGGAMPLPKLAWDFNGTTTDYVRGLVPTTVTGTPTYGSGKYNQSIVFNGSSSIYYTSPVSITTTVGATISFWLYPTSVPYGAANQYYFSANNGIVSGFGIGLNANQTVPLVYFFSGQFASFSSSLVQNSWQHITVVISPGQTCSLYFNGLLSTSFSFSQDFTLSYIDVAQYYGGSSKGFCRLDDLRIFDRSLTSSQVQSIYNQQGVPGRGVQVRAVQPLLAGNATILYGGAPTSNTTVYFPGSVGSYMNLGASSATNINQNTSNIFIEAWVYFNDVTINNRVFNRASSISTGSSIDIVFRTEGTSLMFNYGTGGFAGAATASGLTTGTWIHVAMSSRVGGLSYVFINGNPGTGYSPTPDTYNATYNTYIGVGASAYANMYIRDLRVVQGGVVPTATFTPEAATWAYGSVPSYVTGGTNVLGLAAQYMTPTTLIGTPLFTQLSSGATSSAVGAFSLRAVNGTSARAVQVRRQGQFPPGPFVNPSGTSNGPFTETITGYAFGGTGTYTVLGSSRVSSGREPWRAFDGFDGGFGTRWISSSTYTTNSPYTGTASTIANSVTYPGEWLQIQLPQSIVLSSYSIYPQATNNIPLTWNVFASNDGSTWTVIDQRGTEPTAGQYNNYTISGTPTSYSYYRIGCYVVSSGTSFAIVEMKLYGAPPNTNTDFYADRLGNLLTAPVVGQSLANWLGGATGYVATWYDQSGRGNDATQTTAANQPIIQRATKGPGYMVNFNGTSQFVTLSADSQFLNGTNITVNAVALRTATKTTQNWFFGTNTPSVNYQRFQFGFQSDTIISMNVTSGPTDVTIPAYNASNEPVYYMTGGLIPSRVFYQNDTLGGTNTNVGLMSVPSGYSYSIGNGTQGGVYYYIGTLFELLLFTSALDQTQITQIYNNQFGAYGT